MVIGLSSVHLLASISDFPASRDPRTDSIAFTCLRSTAIGVGMCLTENRELLKGGINSPVQRMSLSRVQAFVMLGVEFCCSLYIGVKRC